MFESYGDCDFCLPTNLNLLYGGVKDPNEPSNQQQYSLQIRINHSLYSKYSSSQNYYYSREVNELLANVRSPTTIIHHDLQCFDDEDEYLKRLYDISEYDGTVQLLSEFYKFHKDLPRWTISQEILSILNYFYDKKRKIEFFKIQKMIENDNKNNPNQPAKGIIGERPYETESTPPSDISDTVNINRNVDNILQEITFQQSLINSNVSQFKFSPPSNAGRNSFVDIQDKSLLMNVPKTVVPALQLKQGFQDMVKLISVKQTTISRTEFENLNFDTQTSRLKTDRGNKQVKPRIMEKDIYFNKDLFGSKNSSYSLPNQLSSLNRYESKLKTSNQNTRVLSSKQKKNDPIMKKKMMQKKFLKLDDAALSLSARNQFEEKTVQTVRSVRSQPFNLLLLDQSISSKLEFKLVMSSRMGQQSSLTTSRKNIDLKESSIEQKTKLKKNFFPIKSKKLSPKTPLHNTFDQALKQSQKENFNLHLKDIQQIPKAPSQHKPSNHVAKPPNQLAAKSASQHIQKPLLTQKNQKMINQLLIPTEVKKLEMKVMQGLQDIQKCKQKKFSFDQKSLNQILLNFQKKQKEKQSLSQGQGNNSSLGQGISISQYDSQNFSNQHQKANTPRGLPTKHVSSQIKVNTSISPEKKKNDLKIKIGKLDLRKLKSYEYYLQNKQNSMSQVQSVRNYSGNKINSKKNSVQTDRCTLNDNIRLTTTIKELISDQQQRQNTLRLELNKQKKPINLLIPSCGIQSRHNSLYPLTPRVIDIRLQSIHNLKQWQYLAIQAASKEYNLVTPRKQ